MSEVTFKLNFDSSTNLEAIAKALHSSMIDAFKYLVDNFQEIIVEPLIRGGKGWKPLVDTAGWKWINSPRGYAQLGFSNPLTPLVLLSALKKSFTARLVQQRSGTGGRVRIGIYFKWADIQDLYKKTIHPAAGKLGMPANRSWFQWVYAGEPLREGGVSFKRTGPAPGVRSSIIAGAEAGRMVRSSGFWEVKPRFRLDIDKLWQRNHKKITNTIRKVIQDKISEGVK